MFAPTALAVGVILMGGKSENVYSIHSRRFNDDVFFYFQLCAGV